MIKLGIVINLMFVSVAAFANIDYDKLENPKVNLTNFDSIWKACNAIRESCTPVYPYNSCATTCLIIGKNVSLRHKHIYFGRSGNVSGFNRRVIFNQMDFMKDKVCITSSLSTDPFGKLKCNAPYEEIFEAEIEILKLESASD